MNNNIGRLVEYIEPNSKKINTGIIVDLEGPFGDYEDETFHIFNLTTGGKDVIFVYPSEIKSMSSKVVKLIPGTNAFSYGKMKENKKFGVKEELL